MPTTIASKAELGPAIHTTAIPQAPVDHGLPPFAFFQSPFVMDSIGEIPPSYPVAFYSPGQQQSIMFGPISTSNPYMMASGPLAMAAGDSQQNYQTQYAHSLTNQQSPQTPPKSARSRQPRKDWVDTLQKQMLETIDKDEQLVRKAKALENEIVRMKYQLKTMGFTDAQIANMAKT